jgi:hypothetical protein
MKFLYCFAVLIFFISCNRMAYEERLERKGKIKCGWYGKMTTEERRNTFPFNQAYKIVLISYPNYATKYVYEEITTPWGEKLPGGPNVEKYTITQPIIDTFKVFQRQYLVYEKAELSQNQIDSLSNLLFNFKLNYRIKYTVQYESCCYKPRNSIIFYGKNDVPIFIYEMCFECFERKFFAEKNNFENLIGCMNHELYKEFFKQCHIKYGIENNQ